MMKSFFKKLAFVMALAMVVSAMAPAATAKAAEVKKLGICLQEDTTWTAKETFEMTEGDEPQDFKFSGAPTDWKSYTWVWTSSDETVATVDAKSGLVTVVADGKTTIKVASDDNAYAGELALTVKAKEVVKTFEVKQTTANSLTLTFADADTAKAAAATVAVTKKITTLVGTNDMPWVLNEAKTKVDGNKVTIQPWVEFKTATYEVAVEGFEPVTVKTAVGAPAKAVLSYANPYIYTETDGKGAAASLKVYDANDVELTSGYDVYFEVLQSEPNGYASVDSSNGALFLYNDPTFAYVQATISYNDANNQRQSFKAEWQGVSTKKPIVTVNEYLTESAVVSTASITTAGAVDKAKADKIDWEAEKVKIGDGTYQVVGLIQKSDNSSYSINKWSVGNANENKKEIDDCTNPQNIKFEYASTDSSKVIVDATTGSFVGVNTTAAGKPVHILVTMYKWSNNRWAEVGIVDAVPVVVEPAKAPQRVTLDVPNKVLLTKGDHTSVKVTPTTWNQYDEKVTTDTIKEVSATWNNKTHKLAIAEGAKDFTIDAKDVHAYFNTGLTVPNTGFTYKVTMKSGKTADFFLTLKVVDANNEKNKDYKLDVKGAEIKTDKLGESASIKVATTVLGEKYGNADFFYGKPDASVAKQNDLYVVVLDQDRKAVTPATAAAVVENKTVEYKAVEKNEEGAAIVTKKAQTYTVQLYKVTNVVDGPNKQKIVLDVPVGAPATFSITNNLPSAPTDVKADLSKVVTVTGVAADGKATVVLNENVVTFKFNNVACKGVNDDNFTIGEVNAVSVAGSDKVYVYSFKAQYKLGAGKGYIEFTVPVYQAFTIAQ